MLLLVVLAFLLLVAAGVVGFSVHSLLWLAIVLVVLALLFGGFAGPRYYRGRRGPMV